MPRPTRVVAIAAAVCVICAAGAAGARQLGPSKDLRELFRNDPLANPAWQLEGPWTYDATRTNLLSAASAPATAYWIEGDHYTGALSARLKLVAGVGRRAPSARLIFARDPESGAYRYVEVTAGARGRVVLGQSGTIRGAGEGVFKSVRRTIGKNVWLRVSLAVDAAGRVTVRLGSARVLTAAAGPLAPGAIGVAAMGSRIVVDSLSFTAAPDREPCLECHAGQPEEPLAPNVGTYWDGSWWRSNRGGSSSVQFGGHGDPGGKAAVPCTGTGGCHDQRLPDPADHRNGTLEGRANPTDNSYHLRSGFIAVRNVNQWDIQVAFDKECYNECHRGEGVKLHSHRNSGDAFIIAPVELGTHITRADAASVGVIVDRHITTRASEAMPDYAPCVSCHDPHGSGVDPVVDRSNPPRPSNRMLRGASNNTSSALCVPCHSLPQ